MEGLHNLRRNHALWLLIPALFLMSGWSYYQLLDKYTDWPPLLSCLAIVAFDGLCLGFGQHAIQLSHDGDSPVAWTTLLVGMTVLAGTVQIMHGRLEGWPTPVLILVGILPAGTVLLFMATQRRVYRLNARASGKAMNPIASFDLKTWFFWPRHAWQAVKLSTIARHLDSESAMALAYRELEGEDLIQVVPKEVHAELSFEHHLAAPERVVEAVPAVEVPKAIEAPTAPVPVRMGRLKAAGGATVADLIREALKEGLTDNDAIFAHVQRRLGGPVKRDNARRQLNRIRGELEEAAA